MKVLAGIVKTIGFIWMYLAGFLIVAAVTGVLMREGEAGVLELLSPLNPVNWLVVLVALLPGLGLLLLSNRLARRE